MGVGNSNIIWFPGMVDLSCKHELILCIRGASHSGTKFLVPTFGLQIISLDIQ